jgi:hypothetical protein
MNRTFPIILILSSLNLAIAQGLKYERKSISYVDILYLSDRDIKIEDEQKKYLLKKLREYIEMQRFDYNQIPEKLVNKFKSALESRGPDVSLDEIVELLRKKFNPAIIKILDIKKEIRAQGLLTEAQRNSFIATKVKALGITAEQALKIMNSAFIYVPVISKYNAYTSKNTYVVQLKAGVIWFRVVYSGKGKSDLKLVVKKETDGEGYSTVGENYTYEGQKLDYKEFAFRTAVIALSRDIQVAVRSIPEFRLGAQVKETSLITVSFPMGTREGIKIDDGYDLVELRQNQVGEITQHKIGFARVIQIADNRSNRNQLSKAKIIIGGIGIEPGIYVIERPRLPIDLLVKLKSNPLSIKTGRKTETMTGYSVSADFFYNLGRNWNISQLLLGGGISFGSGNAENLDTLKSIFGEKPTVFIMDFNFALLKRFYFPLIRIAVVGRSDLILEYVGFSRKDGEGIGNYNLGLAFEIGVEFVATPDFNVGVGIGRRFFLDNKVWGKSEGYSGPFPGAVNNSGMFFSLNVNYALPKLGFDPIPLMKDIVGW